MSQKSTREVFVLAPFQDRTGTDHAKSEVFTVAYETDRQRAEVNEMIHRGFLTFDVAGARRFAEAEQRRSKRSRKQGGA
jgi:hypothetical protein